MTRQSFDSIDVLRLEVEIPPTGPSNLVPNPDGALGAWGWVSPIAGSWVGVSTTPGYEGWGLRFTAPTPSAPTHYYTEPVPVAAGEYAAASFEIGSKSAGAVRMRFEWLNSALAVLSSSVQSGYLFTAGDHAYGPVQAPANTAFARLRFDHYGDTAGADPAAGAWLEFTNVKVAADADSGALGSSRTNLVTNPTIEVDTAGWSGTNGATVTRVTTPIHVGTGALAITSTGSGDNASAKITIPVVGGRDYTVSGYLRSATTPKEVRLGVTWRKADGSLAPGGVSSTHGETLTTAYTRFSRVATAPSSAATAEVALGVFNAPNGQVHYLDAVMVTEGTDLIDYFDGSFTASGTKTYAWTGTPHLSSSTVTDTTLASLPPVEWRNILGKTHVIKTARESLNLGTLEAELLDADLDPATSSTLRPGGGARLLALVEGVWEPVFPPGEIDRLVVTYDDKSVPAKPPRVSMTVLDPTSRLAGHRRPQGVAAIDDLPFVLEGAGVPWNVNGNVDQLATNPAAVSESENATALDQVALTRDSTAGHAWVDRHGVCVATDAAAGASVRTLDEPRYSDLAVGFSSEECINAVVIEALGATGETLTYGPYEDATSIAQWGRRERRFTVHGLTPAEVATLGQTILTRNANPGVTVQSVTLPMRTTADLVDAIRDLGEIVTVSNTAKGLAPTLRVTGVEHTIDSEPAKWLTTLRFATSDSVAAPTVSPAVQTTGLEDTDWTDFTFEGGWANYGAPYQGAQYRRKDGWTIFRGLVVDTLGGGGVITTVPPGFRHGGGVQLHACVSNTGTTRVDSNAAGQVFWSTGGIGFVSLAQIKWPAEQ
jgi:hypothetical protein